MDILKDDRRIEGIEVTDNNFWRRNYYVNNRKDKPITDFKLYGQGAMHCDIPWIAVYHNEEILVRINTQHVLAVHYV